MPTNTSSEPTPYIQFPLSASNYDLQLFMRFVKLKREKNRDIKFVTIGDITLKKQDFPDDFFTSVVGMRGHIDIEDSSIESFGSLEFVEGQLSLCNLKNLKSLGGLKEIDGDFFCLGGRIESLGDLKVVNGYVKLRENLQLRSLGSLEQVGGEFELTNSPIESLGSLNLVGHTATISQTLLTLEALEGIKLCDRSHHINAADGYSVIIPYRFFGNDWNQLQEYLIKKGNPRYALQGNLDLSNRKDILSLNNLVKVYGDVILNNTSLESLGELRVVEGDMRVKYSKNLKSLGKLERVNQNLYLKYSFVDDLGNLTSVKKEIII